MVHSEEGHLTGLVEEIGEGDESVGLLQVENQHSSNEGHALNLQTKLSHFTASKGFYEDGSLNKVLD